MGEPVRTEEARQAFIDAAADYLVNRSPTCQWAREDALEKLRTLDAAYEAEAVSLSTSKPRD